ncbi:MAG: 2-oxoglutarate and iron-dependent oxygenase domain-containing protein [Sphingomonadales bacterium]
MQEIPVIDLSSLGNRQEARATAVGQIADACRNWGFFQVVNHGIPEHQIEKVWEVTADFFRLEMAEKRKISRSRDNAWGYFDRELTKNARDQKEIFDFAKPPSQGLPDSAGNRWPAGLADFRTVLEQYFKNCERLSARILQGFSLGLDLPADRLAGYFGADHTSFMRLNHYPLVDPLAGGEVDEAPPLGDMALHHHTDAGALTVLLQDDVGGLQVERSGEWIDIAPRKGALVINIGDMSQVWSNDRYRAALHRVRPVLGRARYSIPFFYNPGYDSLIQPLETMVGDGAKYAPFTWGEFRKKRADGDFADYGTEVQIRDYRKPE